jgi:hypothetical protein
MLALADFFRAGKEKVFGGGGGGGTANNNDSRMPWQVEYDRMASEEGARDAGSTAGRVPVARTVPVEDPEEDIVVVSLDQIENPAWGHVAFMSRTALHASVLLLLLALLMLGLFVALVVVVYQTGADSL